MKLFQKIAICSHCGRIYEYDARYYKNCTEFAWCIYCEEFVPVEDDSCARCGGDVVRKNLKEYVWICDKCYKGRLKESSKFKLQFFKSSFKSSYLKENKRIYKTEKHIGNTRLHTYEDRTKEAEIKLLISCVTDMMVSEIVSIGLPQNASIQHLKIERMALVIAIIRLDKSIEDYVIHKFIESSKNIDNADRYIKESIEYYRGVLTCSNILKDNIFIMQYLYSVYPVIVKSKNDILTSSLFYAAKGSLLSSISYIIGTIIKTYYPKVPLIYK